MRPAMRNVMVVPGHLRVHICPKVATAAISAAMHGSGYHHAGPQEDGEELRLIPVRHPLDRMVSAWAFFCQADTDHEIAGQHGLKEIGYRWRMPFAEFADICLDRHAENDHTRMQATFHGPHLDGPNATLCPLHLLPVAWATLRLVFPFLKPLHAAHVSRRERDWTTYFTAPLRARAEAVFAPDMALWLKAVTANQTKDSHP